jgi:hypothetical protein
MRVRILEESVSVTRGSAATKATKTV